MKTALFLITLTVLCTDLSWVRGRRIVRRKDGIRFILTNVSKMNRLEGQQKTSFIGLQNKNKGVKFGPLCSGHSDNTIRGCDHYGCGNEGLPKAGGFVFGHGIRKGRDIKCNDGNTVNAPFDVTIRGVARPYGNGNVIDNGLMLEGEGLCFKVFYIKPHKTSGTVKKGDKIGTLLPMQTVYPGITSHVHVRMCDLSDPTKYFRLQ